MKIASVNLAQESDVLLARKRTRNLALELGFDSQDQARIATAVSEIARNTVQYAGKGVIEFSVEGESAPQTLRITVSDDGPGIRNVDGVLSGQGDPHSGPGMGIPSARKLMTDLSIESREGHGTRVNMTKVFPRGTIPFTETRLAQIGRMILAAAPQTIMEEVRHQNVELTQALDELTRRQEELIRLNRELEDTNRGVVALYAELDEKADHLQVADELKSKFLSNMSHEFRTPLNSILALAHILHEGTDGELNDEQGKQVNFIAKAANEMLELVNDFLDLARIEAGKTPLHPTEFEIENVFSALRGMMRPLMTSPVTELVFESAAHLPRMYSDEGKVSQILRNFISNAIKFTERGEVRVSARLNNDQSSVIFSVADTGIGIPFDEQPKLFQEFAQLENPLQKRRKGSGLGLPLSKKLAELLGGLTMLQSRPGEGSTFSVTLPLRLDYGLSLDASAEPSPDENGRIPLLIAADDSEAILMYEKILAGSSFRPIFARTAEDALLMLQHAGPQALFVELSSLDDTRRLLTAAKSSDTARKIPVVVSAPAEAAAGFRERGAADVLPAPAHPKVFFDLLRSLFPGSSRKGILIVDDDEVSRYVTRNLLPRGVYKIIEASDGLEGIKFARSHPIDLIILDLSMPDVRGEVILRRLAADPLTKPIPVIVVTSQTLDQELKDELLLNARLVLSKALLTKTQVEHAVSECLKSAGGTMEKSIHE